MANKVITSGMLESKYLEHYGVKGMKWGVRKDDSKSQNTRIKGLEGLLLAAGLIGVQIAARNVGNKKAIEVANDSSKSLSRLKDAKKIEPPESYLDSIKNTNKTKNINKFYKNNCPNTALAYEARRRGYDVKAKPDVEGLTTSRIHESYNLKHSDLSITRLNVPTRLKENNTKINDYFASVPEGYRGAITLVWESRYGGHIFNVEKRDNKIIFIDSQTGRHGEYKGLSHTKQITNELVSPYTKFRPENYLYKAETFEIFRTDNAKINDEYVKKQLMKG